MRNNFCTFCLQWFQSRWHKPTDVFHMGVHINNLLGIAPSTPKPLYIVCLFVWLLLFLVCRHRTIRYTDQSVAAIYIYFIYRLLLISEPTSHKKLSTDIHEFHLKLMFTRGKGSSVGIIVLFGGLCLFGCDLIHLETISRVMPVLTFLSFSFKSLTEQKPSSTFILTND